jgi:predicted HTH domain antitoxin
VHLDFPDKLGNGTELTPQRVKLEAAVGLYAGSTVTLGQAAELAGICQTDFLHELGKRGICINYGADDLAHDLKMVEVLHPRLRAR